MSEPEPEGTQSRFPVIETRPDSEVEMPPPSQGGPRPTRPTRVTPEEEAKAKGLPAPRLKGRQRGRQRTEQREVDKPRDRVIKSEHDDLELPPVRD